MKNVSMVIAVAALGFAGMMAQPAGAADVKITPLGSHDGEFCIFDRAMVFEDPDGTGILYDAGRGKTMEFDGSGKCVSGC